uniref:Root cap protein 1-like n=1 Tax=Oryza sativa subsp. japonica TaxID=39947 RepID=Q8H5W6_ORYSJ|nr:root cap protein 1-like [Oryza sativa Japonica Group]BAD30544.1 root cap protein 1-like [Oryza sativa Japonica Group]
MANVVPINDRNSRINNYGITEEDNLTHLDLGFKFYDLTDNVHRVLGQTHRFDYVNKLSVSANMPVMGGTPWYAVSDIFSTNHDPQALRYPSPPSPSPLVAGRALAPCRLAPPSPPQVQPCAAVASVVVTARGGRRRGRQAVADLVRPSIFAEDRRNIAVIVNPKVAAVSSSSPSPSVDLPPSLWSPIPTFPESPILQEKILRNSKASKASYTDPKQPFEHVDPV